MSKFCDKCGAQLRNENIKFCDKCGAEVLANKNKSNVRTVNSGALIICPHCGQKTPMEQLICVKCGSSLKNNTFAVVIGYILTLLTGFIALIPGIYLLTRNNEKSKRHGINICVFTILIIFMSFIFAPDWILFLRVLLGIIFIVIGIVIESTK